MNAKEAIERIKTRFDKWALDDEDMKAIQTLIPELKDSENEKIRKALLRCCDDWEKGQYGCMNAADIPSVRAYLEKQKEQKLADNVSKEEYVKRFKALCDAYEIKLPNREYDIYHLCDDLSKLSIDSDEQKPAEWSEKDEVKLNDVIRMIENSGNVKSIIKHYTDFLKSLPERFNLQPKQEWSEEDEKIRNKIIWHLSGYIYPNSLYGEDVKECINWLKSLLPQPKKEWSQKDNEFADDAIACVTRCYERYCDNKDFYQSLRHNTLDIKRWLLNVRKRLAPHWKPSEEQMDALDSAINYLTERTCTPGNPLLISLHHDLQKLL